MTYYKVLDTDGSCYNGGSGAWPENKWMPELEEVRLEPCFYGYHILEEQDLIYWLGPAIAPVEVPETARVVRHGNKSIVARAKRGPFLSTWNETTQRLFAADCAERVLHLYEAKYPSDNRPRRAIEVARLYALGKATAEELRATAASATYAAYAASAATAASVSERQWQTTRLWQYLRGEVNYEG